VGSRNDNILVGANLILAGATATTFNVISAILLAVYGLFLLFPALGVAVQRRMDGKQAYRVRVLRMLALFTEYLDPWRGVPGAMKRVFRRKMDDFVDVLAGGVGQAVDR